MNIGICTTDFQATPLDALFETIGEMGFSSMQLAFATLTESDFVPDGACEIPKALPRGVVDRIAKRAAQRSLDIVCVNGTFNMAHPDQAVRNESIARFPNFARAVRDVGCANISICTGTRNPDYLWSPHPLNETDAAWADMFDAVRRIVDVAEALGLTLLIETEASNTVDTPERAQKLMRDVGSERLKMIMDAANLFHAGEAKPENVRTVIGHAFDVFGADIRLAHGKDILAGPGLAFCGAGDGIVDFPYMLSRLRDCGYAGDMILHGIKNEPQMPKALSFIREVLAG